MKDIHDKDGNFVTTIPSLPKDAEVSLADPEVLKSQRDPDSHREFLRTQKRAQRLTTQVEQFVKEMTTPTRSSGMNVKTISDEAYESLMKGGETLWEQEHFVPVSRYAGAFQRAKARGENVRPFFHGEVGVITEPGKESVYLVLEESEDRKVMGAGLEVALSAASGDGTIVLPPSSSVEEAPPTVYAFKIYRPRLEKYVVVVALSAIEAVEALPKEDQETASATRLPLEFVECASGMGDGSGRHALSFSSSGLLTCLCGRSE